MPANALPPPAAAHARQAARLARLHADAATDALTGLAHSGFVVPYLERRIAQSRRDPRPLGVMLVGLDGLDALISLHGHAAGDEVLRAVARRLARLSRACDMLARLGDGEFLLASEGFGSVSQLLEVGRRLMSALDRPVPCGALRLRLGASIGVALCPAHGHDLPTLVAAADEAMDAARQRGGGLGLAGSLPTSPPEPMLPAI